MPSTYFTAPPDWALYIIPYFFIGGIAGGSMFLAALLQLFGREEDRPVMRLGYYVAFVGVLLSGILLIVDLGRPERFWHMLVQSETWRPMFKWWSPMSAGSWGLTGFGLFAFLGTLGALHDAGRLRWGVLAPLTRGPVSVVVAVLGGIFGFFLAGYTGVLLAVTNRPVWADSNWIGMLFLISGASTAAATLILLGRRRDRAHPATLAFLDRFDRLALLIELVVLVVFLVSLGQVIRVFLNVWGVVLVLGVIGLGILLPLAISMGWVRRIGRPHLTAAALVLVGGFLLRAVMILPSEAVHLAGPTVVLP